MQTKVCKNALFLQVFAWFETGKIEKTEGKEELLKQVEINIDYILMLVQKYHDTHCEDKEILISINKAVESSLELRSKKALIEKNKSLLSIGITKINTNSVFFWRRR